MFFNVLFIKVDPVVMLSSSVTTTPWMFPVFSCKQVAKSEMPPDLRLPEYKWNIVPVAVNKYLWKILRMYKYTWNLVQKHEGFSNLHNLSKSD